MFRELKLAVATTARPNLDALHQRTTQQWANGAITDEECQAVYDQIEKRRRSIFPERRRRIRALRTREELAKRHRLAYSGPMPCDLAAFFTPSELAVMAVIAYAGMGTCVLTVGEIADRALVGKSTVQKAIRRAEQMGLLAVEERKVKGDRNLPNVIRIVSAEWRKWLERGGSKKLKPLDTKFIIPCNSDTSQLSIPVWKRSISRTSPGLFGIPSRQPRCGLVGATNLHQNPRGLIR